MINIELVFDFLSSSLNNVSSSGETKKIELLHILSLVIAGCYVVFAIFPLVSVIRMVYETSKKRREERATLLPREYSTNNAIQWGRRVWVGWFHVFLFIGAATRAGYLTVEGLITWRSEGSEDSDFLIAESTLSNIGTPSFFCCYIVMLGKLLELLNIVPPSVSYKASINGTQQSFQQQQLQQQNKVSKSVRAAILISCLNLILFFSILIAMALSASHEHRHIYFKIRGYSNMIALVIYFILSAGYGLYVMRLACLYNSDRGIIPGLPIVMRRMMALSALLCICFSLRAISMLMIDNRWLNSGHEWFVFIYYVVGELIPQILIIILFVRNQMTAQQLMRQRRPSMFS